MMKKNILSLFAVLLYSLVVVGSAQAYEGRIEVDGDGVRCEAISVWKEDKYRLVGKCMGLEYPYKTHYEHYYVWARDIGKKVMVRVAEIDRGYFDGYVKGDFDRVLITAEPATTPRRPSSEVVASVPVKRFDFSDAGSSSVVSRTDSVGDTGSTVDSGLSSGEDVMTVQNPDSNSTVNANTTGSSTVGRVIGKIVMALFIIVFVVIGMVIVGSLIFRKKGSVS